MSRSGYDYEVEDNWALIKYRGAVASSIRGNRGQAFLREMLQALDALPEKRLISDELIITGQPSDGEVIVGADRLFTDNGASCTIGEVCAIGSVGRARGIDMSQMDAHDPHVVANAFGINEKLAREIVFINDEDGFYGETPEHRFQRVRKWVISNLRQEAA